MHTGASSQASHLSSPILRDIVLIGGGHSHVGVLKSFAMKPLAGVRLTLICTDTHTPYSGMLPGYIAGHYNDDEVHIDLDCLATFAGARLLRDEVIGLDRDAKHILCRQRPPVAYDLASINIGSAPQLAQVPGAAEYAVPVKPIRQFKQRWQELLTRVRSHPGPTTLALVGGGAGGVEMVLAMQFRLRREWLALGRNPDELQFHLFTASATLLPTHAPWVQRRFAQILTERGVSVHLHSAVQLVSEGGLLASNGDALMADEIVWVTQAGGASWLQTTGLELDDSGFIKVNDCLQSLSDPAIFAAGDVASMVGQPLEKAGVFAVRQGMPLAENLRRSILGQRLRAYRPQRRWLALISTGDKYAVASRGSWGIAGAIVWRWKDWIDRRFMARFQVEHHSAAPMTAQSDARLNVAHSHIQLTVDESQQAVSAMAMRCGGCGAKVGADVLSRALRSLMPVDRSDVLIGLHAPDDAAVLRVPPGKAMVHTVDFFRSFIDDPYLFGKVAANHALGDIFAMGGQAQSATAIVTVPPGLEAKVEELLRHMMTGAVEVLNAADCALVGGHTGEGQELALGFAINGMVDADLLAVMRKGGMRPGDALILTKPIGTGTLFAAQPRLLTKGRWIDAALESMVQSNRMAAQILQTHGATACTDVTGFGLLGHLLEMTRPSGVDATIHLSALPLLDGAQECVAAGVFSSLQSANLRLRSALRHQEEFVHHPRYPLLFDPQTAGGLLASVSADQANDCLSKLRAAGYVHACVVGGVLPQGKALEPIHLSV